MRVEKIEMKAVVRVMHEWVNPYHWMVRFDPVLYLPGNQWRAVTTAARAKPTNALRPWPYPTVSSQQQQQQQQHHPKWVVQIFNHNLGLKCWIYVCVGGGGTDLWTRKPNETAKSLRHPVCVLGREGLVWYHLCSGLGDISFFDLLLDCRRIDVHVVWDQGMTVGGYVNVELDVNRYSLRWSLWFCHYVYWLVTTATSGQGRFKTDFLSSKKKI